MKGIEEYRCIVWDFNGTLINDLDIGLEIQRKMLARRSLPPLDMPRYLESFDFPIRDWYSYLGYDVAEYPSLAVEWSAMYDSLVPTCGLNSGARRLLEGFAARNITQNIISASHRGQMTGLLERLGIAGFFANVYGLENNLAETKVHLCSRLRADVPVPPEQMLLIGDTTQDLLTAQTLGCDCALAACGHQSRARLSAVCRDVFPTLDDVADALGIR